METTPVKPNTSDPCDPAPTCAANERLITVEPDFSAGECCPTYECYKGCWEVQTLNGVDTYIKEIVQKSYPEFECCTDVQKRKCDVALIKWDTSFPWSSSISCPMRNLDEMTIGKMPSTLFFRNELSQVCLCHIIPTWPSKGF